MCVHTSHCCAVCGCKYNEPDCPVENGIEPAVYVCEYCEGNQQDWEENPRTVELKAQMDDAAKTISDLLAQLLHLKGSVQNDETK